MSRAAIWTVASAVLVLPVAAILPSPAYAQEAIRPGVSVQRSSVPTSIPRSVSSGEIFAVASRGPLRHPMLRDTTDSLERQIRPTHWKEGALIGGLSLGIGFGLLSSEICQHSEGSDGECSAEFAGGVLLGAVLGGLTGALIGGQFPKHNESVDAEETE